MTCGVYFGKSIDSIRIGQAIAIEERTKDHQGSSLSYTVAFILDCRSEELLKEEKLAFNFFKKYHIKGSFYSLEIEHLIPEYIEKRKQEKLNKKNTKGTKGKIDTLFGEERMDDILPRCSFFPEQTAAYMGQKNSIRGIKPRTIFYNGKKVIVCEKMKKIYQQIVKDTKERIKLEKIKL